MRVRIARENPNKERILMREKKEEKAEQFFTLFLFKEREDRYL